MRRFIVHLVTEVDFVDGDEASNDVVQTYKKYLAEIVEEAAEDLFLQTIKGSHVESVSVAEIKAEV
jgi:hypothetical protein